MSLKKPENVKEEYIHALRLHMERLFGTELKSVYLSDVDFKSDIIEKTFKIETIRFQQHFPVLYPILNLPCLDVFINPVTNKPRISIQGENPWSSDMEELIPPDKLEHLFCSIIWGAKVTKNGIEVHVRPPILN